MKSARFMLIVLVASMLGIGPAAAHHTEPDEAQGSTEGAEWEGLAAGEGEWTFIRNFPANPGTDLEFFERRGQVYSSSGTLGGAAVGHAGQRFLRLVDAKGNVEPAWVADHGSAACVTNPSGATGLQHDVQLTPADDPQLAVDATDATGRCHDPGGGGLELIDISGIGRKNGNEVREVHLTRHDGTSHNVTVDATRPWILYSSNTDADRPWIDVVDISTCLDKAAARKGMGVPDLVGTVRAAKRQATLEEACRPTVYRMPFDPAWTSQRTSDGKLANPFGCHDITAEPGRLYCAAINGTAIFDVTNLTNGAGKVRGTPLPWCKVIDGTNTSAKVTDCDVKNEAGENTATVDAELWKEAGKPQAKGWSLVGNINHPGTDVPRTNTNFATPSDEGVAVSHEAERSPDGRWLFVTDERGGGVVPPGASCGPRGANPVGNGGMHVFDISNPAKPKYALTPDGDNAVFITENTLPYATFCNIHLIEHLPDEQRIVMAWYSQGIKIVDYEIDKKGRWSFEEVASYTLPGAQTWAAEQFKIVDDGDSRTYYFMLSDIARGVDIVSFTEDRSGGDARAAATEAVTGTPALKLTDATKTVLSVLLPQSASRESRQSVCTIPLT